MAQTTMVRQCVPTDAKPSTHLQYPISRVAIQSPFNYLRRYIDKLQFKALFLSYPYPFFLILTRVMNCTSCGDALPSKVSSDAKTSTLHSLRHRRTSLQSVGLISQSGPVKQSVVMMPTMLHQTIQRYAYTETSWFYSSCYCNCNWCSLEKALFDCLGALLPRTLSRSQKNVQVR